MEIYGFDELEKELLNLLKPAEIIDEMDKIGNKLVTDVKLRTPVDTGRLRGSIDKEDAKKQGNDYVVEVGTNVKYAQFVENGFKTKSGGFKDGKHMFQTSIQKLKIQLPAEINRWLNSVAGRLKI